MKKHLLTTAKAIGFILVWVALISLMVPIAKSGFLQDSAALSRLLWEFLPLAGVLLVTFIFVRVVEKNKIQIPILKNPLNNVVLGLALGIVWIFGSVGTLYLLGNFRLGAKNEVSYLAIWFLAVLLNATMQEYLVRGYLFSLLREKHNTALAIAATTILFTAMHGGAFGAGTTLVLNVITMSVFVSLLLVYTGSLLAPIIVHFIWNGVGRLVFGAVSLADDYPSAWAPLLTGHRLLSGGAAKIEGSVVVLAANLILIAFMLFLIRKQRKGRA
jgi:membrane protease YdiL (CAAX protease family)